MHNFEYFAKDNYKFFDGREKAAEQVANLKYIAQLAAQSHTDISDWDLAVMFGDFTTTKGDINKTFFEAREKTVEPARELTTKEITAIAAVGKHLATKGTRTIDQVNLNIDQYATAIKDNQANITNNLARVQDLKAELDLLEAKGDAIPDFATMIREIEADGFFSFKGASDADRDGDEFGNRYAGFEFVTKADVIVHYRNDAQRIDCTVNFGRFRVTITKKKSIKVCPAGRNVQVADRYHPHVFDYGLCLGATATAAGELLNKNKLPDVMRLIASILVSYNPKDSYVDIVRFAAKQQKKDDPYTAPVPARGGAAERPLEEPPQQEWLQRTQNIAEQNAKMQMQLGAQQPDIHMYAFQQLHDVMMGKN